MDSTPPRIAVCPSCRSGLVDADPTGAYWRCWKCAHQWIRDETKVPPVTKLELSP